MQKTIKNKRNMIITRYNAARNGIGYVDGNDGEILNAHLSYKGRSVIIDYEFYLHSYNNDNYNFLKKDRNKFVPFEVYPYGNDIYVGYVEVDEDFHKADMGKLIEALDKALAEEPEPYDFASPICNKQEKTMTREEIKRRAELYSALAEGKTIQVQNPNGGEWFDVKIETLRSICEEFNYRIKSEPKYRPFKNKEECWQEMHKHPDFGWVTDGYYKSTISVKSDSIVVTISSLEYDFGKAYIHFTFADGTPFGIKEE